MSINYKEKYLKYKKKYLELKNQLGGQMNVEEFNSLCYKVSAGKTAEVLAAVDQDRRLATRADGNGDTLLIWACRNFYDNTQLAQGILKKGANVHYRNKLGEDALMFASYKGHIKHVKLLLDYGVNPDSNNGHESALWLAARYKNLEVCLLLISRGANLMRVCKYGTTALKLYGDAIIKSEYWRFMGSDIRAEFTREIEEGRPILIAAFERGPIMCWKRRRHMMSVIVGCGFRPLAGTIIEEPSMLRRLLKPLSGKLRPFWRKKDQLVPTPEQRRAHYMQIIFRCDGLLRRIVSFL
jgi:Ankyrin repeats (3 copies)